MFMKLMYILQFKSEILTFDYKIKLSYKLEIL